MKKHCYNAETSADPRRKSHAGTTRQPRHRVCATNLYGRVCTYGSVRTNLYVQVCQRESVRTGPYVPNCTYERKPVRVHGAMAGQVAIHRHGISCFSLVPPSKMHQYVHGPVVAFSLTISMKTRYKTIFKGSPLSSMALYANFLL